MDRPSDRCSAARCRIPNGRTSHAAHNPRGTWARVARQYQNPNRRTVAMYHDPKLPDPGLGRNPPRYRDPNPDTFGPGSIVAMILGTVLIVGAVAYAVSGPSKNSVRLNMLSDPIATKNGEPACFVGSIFSKYRMSLIKTTMKARYRMI